MLERLVLAALIIGFGVGAWYALNVLLLRRAAKNAPTDPLLVNLRPNTPSVVYFTTPFCEPCRTQQQPALARLQAELGTSLQVVQVDATAEPDVADRWGVFSAPTTFVIDQRGEVRHVNRGVASTETLRRQLEAA